MSQALLAASRAGAVLAHGFADAADLLVPLQTVMLLAGGAVLGVTALMARRARAPVLRRERPLPLLSAVVDAPVTRAALRGVALLVLAGCAAVALLGDDQASVNPIPRLTYGVAWPGLLLISALLGPVWRVANPLRGITAAVHRIVGDPDEQTVSPLPAGLGVRPAAALLAVFVWGELVLPDRPSVTVGVMALVALSGVAGGTVYGRAWFLHGDPFEAAGDVLARLAPLRRGTSGRLVLGWPAPSLCAPRDVGLHVPGSLALLGILIGAHVFDGLSETTAWRNTQVGMATPLQLGLDTLLLVGCAAGVAGLVALTTLRHARLRTGWVPLVAGYAFAHYFPVLPIEAQVAAAQLSDPSGTGADLFGTANLAVSVDFLSGEAGALILLTGLVLAHCAAVVVAHHAIAGDYDPRTAGAIQFGFRAVVVAGLLSGVALRFLG